MYRLIVGLAVAALVWPAVSHATCGGCKAERVTPSTANALLFGGTDAVGGIDDWALTNGKIQAIIDDIGNQDPIAVVGGSVSVEHTTSNAVETGGTLIDLGLKGKNNDQLPQSFNVGGLSLANVFLFRPNDGVAGGWSPAPSHNPCASIESSDPSCPADPGCAAITVYGIMLSPNVSTRTAPTLWARTRYQACTGSTSLQLRTEVWNKSGVTQNNPIFDVFLWGGRGITPFVANSGRGFNHPVLQLSALEAIANLNATTSPFFAAPGNVNKKNGKVSRGKNAGAVSYGYRSEGGLIDNDGPNGGGAGAPFIGGLPDQLKALHANLLSAVTFASIPSGPLVPDGGSVIFNRRIVVGGRNDAASVLGDALNPDSVFVQMGYGTGTVSGHISPGSKEEATIVFVRDNGPVLSPPIEDNSPVSQVRTKASFSNVQLPEGNYSARVSIPGKDELVVPSAFTITAFNNSVFNINASVLPKPGTLQFTVVDGSGNPLPAKVSISPSPSFHKDIESFNFNRKTGFCSNDMTVECVNDIDCGGSNTCFRTCSNVATKHCESVSDCSGSEVCADDNHCRSHACSSDAACGTGEICVADAIDNQPEGFAGGNAQLNVIYAENGKVKQGIKPGTYDVYVSRGLEYSIKRIQGVTIAAGATNNTIGTVTLKRVVDTTGYESADFHIHSCRSLDSSASATDRVRSFAGEGLEVMISTDHDVNTDYSPTIAKLKVGSFVGSVVGTEVTTSVGTPPYFSNSWGHINGWPQIYDPNLRRGASIEDENIAANVIYDRLRAVSDKLCVGGKNNSKACSTLGPGPECPMGTCTDVGQGVVSLNHPRAGVSGVVNIGMFDNVGYDPSDTINSCHKYPVICPSSSCYNGTNDGTSCTTSGVCTGGGVCGCDSASVPLSANGCNNILRDLNVVPQATICDTPGCGSGFEDAAGTRNIDFDMMEIDNGGSASSFGGLREVRRDWMSLLNQNVLVGEASNRHPLWGEGVSDSHRVVAELPGYSRTFVGAGDFNGSVNVKTFDDAVRAGNMTATAGPYIEFTLDNGGSPKKMGETLSVPGGGAVNLNIKVKAAPWIPMEEVRVIENGCVVACFNESTTPAVTNSPSVDADYLDDTTSRVVRFNATVPETAGADSYFIVEASPNLPTPGDDPEVDPFVNAVAAGDFPFGFTNPIFVDTDGSGYGGIGVPEPVCGALPASCSAGAAISSAPTAARQTMFAKTETNQNWLSRLWDRIVGTATADEQEKRPPNEEDRIREHEKNIRKSSQEYYPWHMIRLPTPEPTPK